MVLIIPTRVRRAQAFGALSWLKQNNLCYADVTIDIVALRSLPEDGVPDQILSVDVDDDDTDSSDDDNLQDDHDNSSRSFLPLPVADTTEDEAVHSIINSEHTEWPDIGQTPVNEFQTPFLATMAFPTLFPYAQGDPTNPGRQRAVSLTDALAHLIRYGERTHDDQWKWRFASHPRFPYWGLNMKQRHQLLSQVNVYLHQHPHDAE